jgi:hypothetical protein
VGDDEVHGDEREEEERHGDKEISSGGTYAANKGAKMFTRQAICMDAGTKFTVSAQNIFSAQTHKTAVILRFHALRYLLKMILQS